MVIVKGVLASRVSKFFGFENLEDGMLAEEGMEPMGAGLQEPPLIC